MLLFHNLKLHSFLFTAAFNTQFLSMKLIHIIFLILFKNSPEKDICPGKSRRLETVDAMLGEILLSEYHQAVYLY